jgi:hypothetical protein
MSRRPWILVACALLPATAGALHAQVPLSPIAADAAVGARTPIVVLPPLVRSRVADPLPIRAGLLALPTCEADRTQGQADAATLHGGGGRFIGGFFLGLGLGLIGTGIAWAIAGSSDPQPIAVPDDLRGESVDANCYRQGYMAKARSKNKSSALLGGLTGTAVGVAIVLAATSGS